MTNPSRKLSMLRRTSSPSTVTSDDACLGDMKPGMTCHVTGMDADMEPCMARRLFDLGFVPGTSVTVLRRAPLADPVMLLVAESEIVLRCAQIRGIGVRRVA